MDKQEMIEELVAWASEEGDLRALAEGRGEGSRAALVEAAAASFGSWPLALASALAALARLEERRRPASRPAATVALAEAPDSRVVTEASEIPLYLMSAEGHLLQLPLDELPCAPDSAWRELPGGPGRVAWPTRIATQGDDETFFALGTSGLGGTLIRQHFIPWSHEAKLVRMSDRLAGMDEDAVAGLFPRRQLRQFDRLYAFSTDGNIKASDSAEYAKRVGAEAIDVILPREGEYALTMFVADTNASIFVASSAGKAIVFSAEEIRSQGRKAQGMRAILLDEGARAVSAFPVESEECVLVTAKGFVKRMSLAEFRAQGRGGGGLQTVKLGGDDEVIAVLPVSVNDDLLLVSEEARYVRIPAWRIPLMGRAARGEAMVSSLAGDRIADVIVVPPGADA